MLGMSGGVDSSVSAAVLLHQGYDVTGVTLDLIDKNSPCHKFACKAISNAKSVANQLGMEHMCIDLSAKFSEYVIKDFISCYINGFTPNPCVRCNKYIKFGAMFEIAKNLGFDYIATGHYANIEYEDVKNRFLLKKSQSKKDQSYFLYNLKQEHLARTIFPIGNREKSETRLIAQKYGLPTASNEDSQEICFIKDEKYTDFIYRNSGLEPKYGNFIDVNGNIIGTHRGVINYTIGQRKKLGMSFGKPMFVTDINSQDNTITLAEADEMSIKGLILKDVSFTYIQNLKEKIKVEIKTRYRSTPVPATVKPIRPEMVEVRFEYPHKCAAPGQSAVFYDGDIVIGGGIITKIIF